MFKFPAIFESYIRFTFYFIFEIIVWKNQQIKTNIIIHIKQVYNKIHKKKINCINLNYFLIYKRKCILFEIINCMNNIILHIKKIYKIKKINLTNLKIFKLIKVLFDEGQLKKKPFYKNEIKTTFFSFPFDI